MCKQEMQTEKGRSSKTWDADQVGMKAEMWCSKKDGDRDRQKQGQGKGSREQKAGRGQGLGGVGTNKRDREGKGGQPKLGESEGQQASGPLPPHGLSARLGSGILRASPETPACWSMKARRKAAKLEGGRGPDVGVMHPGGWQWAEETLPCLMAPTVTHPTLTQTRDGCHTQLEAKSGWMGVLLQGLTQVSAGDREREWLN